MNEDRILVYNAGSSSLKFQAFEILDASLRMLVRGEIGGIGSQAWSRIRGAGGETLEERTFPPGEMPDLPAAIRAVRAFLADHGGARLRAIGHRVVHGGPEFDRPVRVSHAVLARLAELADLAPLHQPHNLAPIRLAMATDPRVPQVACFDTAFHRGHPDVADWYALPPRFHAAGIRRYGFHGLSYEYVARHLRAAHPLLAAGRVVVAHLGSGASMCAIADGRSVESTMGFTPLDGLPMGTRPGQIDPGVVLHMIERMGMTAAGVSELLYHESGLKGLSGLSGDMRDLIASDLPAAAFAIEHYVHRAAMYVSALAGAMDGIDGLVFTAGVGENAPAIRARIAERLKWLGVDLDEEANARGESVISTGASRVTALVVHTDEERMIAEHTLALLSDRTRPAPVA